MASDTYADIFDLMERRLRAIAAFNHLFTTALLAQRSAVVKTAGMEEMRRNGYPFIPVLWSTTPSWLARSNLAMILREDTLLAELETIRDIVEIPSRPYFIFGVHEGTPRMNPRAGAGALTAAEVLCLVFFTQTLFWRPSMTYIAGGSRLANGTVPVFGYNGGRLTFSARQSRRTVSPTLLTRTCFLPARAIH